LKPGIHKTELITRAQDNTYDRPLLVGGKKYYYQCADGHYDQAIIDAAKFRKMGFFTKVVKSSMLTDDGKPTHPTATGRKDRSKDGRPIYRPWYNIYISPSKKASKDMVGSIVLMNLKHRLGLE
jgi:hypothetical protein